MAKVHLYSKTIVPQRKKGSDERANGEVLTYYVDPAIIKRYLSKYEENGRSVFSQGDPQSFDGYRSAGLVRSNDEG